MNPDDDHQLPHPRPHRETLPPGEPLPHPDAEVAPGHRPPPTPGPDTTEPADPWHALRLPAHEALDAAGRTLESVDEALALLLGLVGRDRSGPPALWFAVVDAQDRVLPVVLPIPEVPVIADPVVAANLVHVLASVLEHDAPGGAVLVAYVRRGGGDRGAFEGGWSRALRDEASRAGVRIRVEAAIGQDRARVLDPRW